MGNTNKNRRNKGRGVAQGNVEAGKANVTETTEEATTTVASEENQANQTTDIETQMAIEESQEANSETVIEGEVVTSEETNQDTDETPAEDVSAVEQKVADEAPAEETSEAVAEEPVVKSQVMEMFENYASVMALDKAPTTQERQNATAVLSTALQIIIGGSNGPDVSAANLINVLEFARENRGVFVDRRMMNGVFALFSTNKAAQREISTLITVFERLIDKGVNAKIPFANITFSMQNEGKAEKLRAALNAAGLGQVLQS